MSDSLALHLTDKDFAEQVTNYKGIVLVDFWASWCGPCKILAPTVEKLATKYQGHDKVKIAKLDVDEAQETSQNFNILSIPTMILFVNGQQSEMTVGVQSETALDSMISKALAKLG